MSLYRRQRHLALRFIVLFLAALSLLDLVAMLVIVGLHAYSPSWVGVSVLSPMTFTLAGGACACVLLGLLYSLLAYPAHRRTTLVLTLIVAGVLGAHLYAIDTPADCHDSTKNVDGCAMDEVYYVPAAQAMLSGERCAPYADNCNLEHPFLSKAFIAAGIAIFGNATFGWRIFEVLLGTFSIPLLFGICLSVSRNKRLALFAAFLLAFETLFFVHSSIAVIDVSAIFFALLGLLFYFAKARWWKLDNITLAAIAFGLSALSKETAIVLLFVLVIYHMLYGGGTPAHRFSSTLELGLSVFLVFALGLQVYDSLLGSGSATNFLGQIDFIMKYGASLSMVPPYCWLTAPSSSTVMTGCGWIDSVLNTPITPLNWITYYSPIGYLVTNVKVTTPTETYSYVSAGYYGITNQFEVWLVYLWGAYVIYLWRQTKGGERVPEDAARDFVLARFALLWVVLVLVAYTVLFLYGRVTYPYYFIQAVPALSTGSGYFLTRSWFPKGISYIVLAGIVLWFFLFYPDKSFLPEQFRAWLGH